MTSNVIPLIDQLDQAATLTVGQAATQPLWIITAARRQARQELYPNAARMLVLVTSAPE
ncbi:MAG: hypothetical protein LC131_03840 [Anaerolineae bacterium]|nr:hypothetical protein [Anaerolineae bacterium]